MDDQAGRVVGLGALCGLRPKRTEAPSAHDFSVGEFVMLQDGRRVTLHEDRGFTLSFISPAGGLAVNVPVRESRENLIRAVLNVVLPDDDDPIDEHPWSWLASLAQARGLAVTANDLRGLPYHVILSADVDRWLTAS